ncbi:hypothetical protein AVEN_265278-1 [Araneus ventricosus]|uniref:Tc1-like transposase DDE domain-containing protein n=1 Tax=Araneus ventricosus TaxID=182803 RepID=A0A4Y2P0H5_ARAVE|nr:hypothetical protein AVEN_265278-1 [Araneus ventricosus]
MRKAILTSGIVLIGDNTRPHNTVDTHQFLEQFKWDLSDHPTYIPDLATSDFHLFLELKNWLEAKACRKMKRLEATLRSISHNWRERSSKRGSETWSTYMTNA